MTENPVKNWRDYLRATKESVAVYRWVWQELLGSESKRYARRMLLFVFLTNAFHMLYPWIVGFVFDSLVKHNSNRVIIGIVGAGLVMIIGEICQFFEATFRELTLGANMGSLDSRTSKLFMEKSLGQHLRESETLSAANVEKGRARVLEVEHMLLFEGCETIMLLVISYSFLWFVSPVAGLLVTGVFLVYIVWSFYMNYLVNEVCTPIDSEFRALNRYRVERWERIERVKTCGKEEEESVHMNAWFDRTIARDRRFWLWYIRQISLRNLLNTAALIGILVYGANLVLRGSWQIGVLYPLLMWTRNITDNMWRLGNIEHRLNWNMPTVRAMKDALTMPPEVTELADARACSENSTLRVELREVSHTYRDALRARKVIRPPRPVLSRVSFSIESGEIVALLGRSGAGKTTVMRLLLRGMDPDDGSIEIDGTNLRELRLTSWLGRIGYIPQQPAVLDGTIRSNLLYGLSPEARAVVSDEELWELIRRFEINFGDRLTDGLDTRVGRNGLKLSGGEAQRIMIGAAAMKRPQFMVIDEATSSLDSTTERAVQAGFRTLLGNGMSALVIAHRLSTVRLLATKFVVLRRSDELVNGTPQVEAISSSFEELAEISPTFRMLARDQGVVLSS